MRAKTLTCIIIDDDPLFNKKMEYLLDKIKWIKLINAYDHSVQGATAIFNEKPDLVLLDIDMPYVDGFALMDWVSPRLQKMQNPPIVVVISARSQPITENDDEIDGFIHKASFNDAATLEKHLNKIVERKMG